MSPASCAVKLGVMSIPGDFDRQFTSKLSSKYSPFAANVTAPALVGVRVVVTGILLRVKEEEAVLVLLRHQACILDVTLLKRRKGRAKQRRSEVGPFESHSYTRER